MTVEFFDGVSYWQGRWSVGGGPGKGSRGRLGAFKAEVINEFAAANGIRSVTELGCGNGEQFALLKVPRYIGVDISEAAIATCKKTFAGRSDCEFYTSDNAPRARADAVLSLDVIYHLTNDAVFDAYMRDLFSRSDRYVVIYSSNHVWNEFWKLCHVKHRKFTRWIDQNAKGWKLVKKISNRHPRRWPFLRQYRSFCQFYIFSCRIPPQL